MYSVFGDTVLDPFAGTGTTLLAAMAAGRNSAGVELETDFYPAFEKKARHMDTLAREVIEMRIQDHLDFAARRKAEGKPMKYINDHYGFAVTTRQETRLQFFCPNHVDVPEKGNVVVRYHPFEAPSFLDPVDAPARAGAESPPGPGVQKHLF
jgi:16S rRNA G966 N2-methylase RsmD